MKTMASIELESEKKIVFYSVFFYLAEIWFVRSSLTGVECWVGSLEPAVVPSTGHEEVTTLTGRAMSSAAGSSIRLLGPCLRLVDTHVHVMTTIVKRTKRGYSG